MGTRRVPWRDTRMGAEDLPSWRLESGRSCTGGTMVLDQMNAGKTPKEIVDEAHRGYYAAGGYSDDRYAWTIRTFMPACRGIRILEVGCGNGGLLELLKSTNEVVGVDASADGIAACASRGI